MNMSWSRDRGRRGFLKTIAAGAAGAGLPVGLSTPAPRRPSPRRAEKPNILFIMADDIGAECFGCYGSTTYKTPHVDALAASGIRFDNGYSTPLCTPSRAQAMTGRYPFRTGWDHLIERGEVHGLDFFDPSREFTFGHALQEAGYATAASGKWQLARLDEHPNHPRACGFDEHYLWAWKYDDRKHSRYWNPGIVHDGAFVDGAPDAFGPNLYADYLIDFMRRHRDGPFFAYFPMALPHGPFIPPPGTPGDRGGARQDPALHENFAAMVSYMDGLVGRLIAALDEMGLREDTLVLFTADNGTHRLIRSRLHGATVEGGKGDLTEPGTRVPLVASWKGTTPEGRTLDDLVDLSDMLPTFAEMAGTDLPSGIPIDGRSFLPQLRGKRGDPRAWVCCEFQDDWFLRSRRWRLRKNGELADMSDRYAPRVVAPGAGGEAAEARRRLQAAARTLFQIRPDRP